MGMFSINALTFHGPRNISITINNIPKTLWDAASSSSKEQSLTGIDYTYSFASPVNPGHNASQIWVSVKDGETTLSNALSSSKFPNRLCPKSTKPTTYSTSPADKTQPYHYATEVLYKEPVYILGILITPGVTLQDAINNGEFAVKNYKSNCYDNDLYWYDSCDNIGSKKQECGADSCDAWSAKYISGNYYYQKRTCHKRGCNSTAISCFDNTYTEVKNVGPVSTGGHGPDRDGTTPPATGGGCFLADTHVLMADGSSKEIKDIVPEDVVVSYDTETNQFVTSVVGKLIIHDGKDSFMNDFSKFPLISLSVLTKDKLITFEVTVNHPFYDPVSKKFKQLREFKVGDELKTIYGGGIIVKENNLIDETSSTSEKSTVIYNLEISQGPKNYIANGIIVHNGIIDSPTGSPSPPLK